MAKYVIELDEEDYLAVRDYLAVQEGIAFVLGMRSGKTIIIKCMDSIQKATPLGKVLEDIKAEIEGLNGLVGWTYEDGVGDCCNIIDKHIGKE